MTLLVVDDSAIVRHTISRLVQDGSFTAVHEARNGREGLELFLAHRPDVVTLDITMPEMDGLACVTEMKRHRPEARILIISALSHKGPAIEAIKRGAMGFLLKPVTVDRLGAAIVSLLK